MNHLPLPTQLMLPFLLGGFLSFLFSGWPYFMQGRQAAGTFVGLWAPSIHLLGTLRFSPVESPADRDHHESVS